MSEIDSRPPALPDGSVVPRDPEIHRGEPVFVGTRVPAQTFIEHLEGGYDLDEFLITSPASAGSRRSTKLDDLRPRAPEIAAALGCLISYQTRGWSWRTSPTHVLTRL